ncbi:hypothetical protein CTAYLR_004799 [Chrysophaeum taylorii]|uniref:Transcription elongation factor 1 homolog n=1 Tax=Chrysophaeum taylorii TaxID=2483200 RepID=A0AAD7UP81_9STRA|nr:hypothetical protein CTAYLR_004799 [Chrysophaeum taylorii]
MGRRKKSSVKKAVKRKRTSISTQFKCPFCNHEDSVEATLKYEQEVGTLVCRVCGASYSATINYLSEPIDVFSEWIDHCEQEQEEAEKHAADEEEEDEELDARRSVRARLE